MNKSYDVYMCRERKESEIDVELALEALKKFSVKDRYAGMGKCKSWTERYLGDERYFNAPK